MKTIQKLAIVLVCVGLTGGPAAIVSQASAAQFAPAGAGAAASARVAGPPSPGTICLDVRNNGSADHTPVQAWKCNGSDAQKWTYTGFAIKHIASGKCLDGYDMAVGRHLYIYACNQTPAQHWVRNTGIYDPGWHNPEKMRCLDGFDRRDGTRFKAYTCNDTMAQWWNTNGYQAPFNTSNIFAPGHYFVPAGM